MRDGSNLLRTQLEGRLYELQTASVLTLLKEQGGAGFKTIGVL